MSFVRKIKSAILRCRVPPCHPLGFTNALLELGTWLRTHPAPIHFQAREQLFEHVAGLTDGMPFDYLEAGVMHGESIRHWAHLSSHPQSRFFGFDTFTGLPEPWQTGLKTYEPGTFSNEGKAPKADDSRITFVQGLFQNTLPGFLASYRRQSVVVVHCDADLYTSTLYWLCSLDPVLRDGATLLFDDFSVPTHDFRAFIDYTSAFRQPFEILATAEVDFAKIAIRLTPRM